MKQILMILFCCLGIQATSAENPGPDRSPIYIDVRTPFEFESGHLAGARNISFDSIDKHIHEITTDKGAPIVLYCKTGRRSGFAKQTLEQMGYSNVANAGGINDVLQRTGAEAATGPECRPVDC